MNTYKKPCVKVDANHVYGDKKDSYMILKNDLVTYLKAILK